MDLVRAWVVAGFIAVTGIAVALAVMKKIDMRTSAKVVMNAATVTVVIFVGMAFYEAFCR